MNIFLSSSGGVMEQFDTSWIFSTAEVCKRTGSSAATLELAGVFIMVAAGILVGLVLLLVEIACNRRKGEKKRQMMLVRRASSKWRSKVQVRLHSIEVFYCEGTLFRFIVMLSLMKCSCFLACIHLFCSGPERAFNTFTMQSLVELI